MSGMSRQRCQFGQFGQTAGFLILLAALAAAAPKAKDTAWAVESAPYRVQLHAAAPPDVAAAGWEIRLPDFGAGRADMRDVVL